MALTKVLLPSSNETVPVGAPPFPGATVITKVTYWLKVLGFGFAVTVVVVEAWLTVCVKTTEVLPFKLELPLYTAVIECDPVVSEETASWAELPESVADPSELEPSKNVTVPVAETPEGG